MENQTKVTILGAGFGGLELSTLLSEAMGNQIEVTLIDKNDSFTFGYSKLDVMFGLTTLEKARMPYRNIMKPGIRFLQQTATGIDPKTKRITTNEGTYDADYLVIALGADYDFAATPGLIEAKNEFYSFAGANHLSKVLQDFSKGRVVIGVAGAPFKCPPAPSECALLLHDYLIKKGVRNNCEISLVIPFGKPVPPSPETSSALVAAFKERDIKFIPSRKVTSVNSKRQVVVLDDGSELPYDLFLGVPKLCPPKVLETSGMLEDGWVTVNEQTLETPFPGVFAIGDIAGTETPRAGVFAENGSRAVAKTIVSCIKGEGQPGNYSGAGSCYIEFGDGKIGRVDVDFHSGPSPTGTYYEPSTALRAEKNNFGSSRRARWFGL